eukprot:gene14239-5264_t
MPVSVAEGEPLEREETGIKQEDVEEESERIQMEELAFLANTFSGCAATVLQRGFQGDWIRLRELLQIMQPIGTALLQFHEVQHYVQRLFQFIDENSKIAVELKLPEILKSVFVDFQYEKTQLSYPSAGKDNEVADCREQQCRPRAKEIVNNNPDNLFNLSWKDIEKKLQPKQLSLIDIPRYLPRVISEISRQEAVWNEGLGLTLIAANTDIPADIQSHQRSFSVQSENSRLTSSHDTLEWAAAKMPKTGLEVVESLVKSQSLELTKIWYLNLKESKQYNPYDLVVVSKNKLNPEHFVISVFGVLHVKPGGESELVSLGQWFREAIVFRTIQKIDFFKNFQICKALMLWRNNVNYLKFLKIRKQVKDMHLLEVPSMMSAILKIKSLLSEMQDVSLLPSDTASCYSLDKFNQAVFLILQNAKKYAGKLNSHCQKILSKVEKDCLEFLQYSEFQIEQKSNNIKESMTLARQRRNKQLKNLKVAKYIGQKLPCFVRLVEELLHQFMLVFISENIANFVHGVMGANSIERKGLFSAAFVFDPESSSLVLSPSPEEFIRSLKVSFDNIPVVLSESCLPFTLEQTNHTGSKSVINNEDLSSKLTVDELRVLLNHGPREAHEAFKQGNLKSATKTVHDYNENESMKQIGYNSAGFLLEVRLAGDKVLQNCLFLMQSLMQDAFAEVNEFAEDHKWIAAIHSFVKTWNQETLESWKGQTASKIEKQVQQIRTWMDQVEAVEKSMATSNGLLFVDGSNIQDIIVPGLHKIFISMMDMISNNCLLSSEELIAELHETSKVLSAKTTTIEEFASFYKSLKQCKERTVVLQNKEEYLKSIFEVVRHCYRQLTSDEEDTEERVNYLEFEFVMLASIHRPLNSEWNSYLYILQDANNRVNELLPQMLENLESSISNYEEEESAITEKVTSGKFLDATEDPKILLPELKELHTRFLEVKEELLKLVKCKEIIEETVHDLTSLSVMHSKIIARHELWKYCEVTAYTIKDWLQTPFTKFQVKKVIAKVAKWREAVIKLKKDIASNDEVLKSWIEKVEGFGVELPLLLELSSVSLKARHWKWLFAGLGQVYDQSYQYLISDLVGFGLRENSQLIVSICDSAAAEFALESHLKKMIRRWEEEEFRLMRYYQESKNKAPSKGTKALSGSKPRFHKRASSGDMFILTGVNELQAQVEDNLVTLQSMLVSPHLSEMRNQAEAWTGYLHQLKEILDTWISCQQKWLYLKKIFDKFSSSNLEELRVDFHDIDAKYKEHMSAVLKDPKVLSVLEKKRGDRGYRELQGENLRKLLFQLVTKQEKVIKSLDSYLDEIRASFPRLFFLSNSEMLELLAISQDPKALVPFVRKCFPGIVNLKFVLPATVSSTIRTQLDAALNAHLLEVVCLYGHCGEEMNLAAPVPPCKSVEKWFCDLELAMKSLLWNKMARCIEERFLYTPSIDSLLSALGVISKNQQPGDISRPSSARMKLAIEEGENAYWYMENGGNKYRSIHICFEIKHDSGKQKAFASEIDDSCPILADKSALSKGDFERQRVYDRQGCAEIYYGAKNSAQFGMLSASQMGLSFPYGYEYQGPTSRLVITPMTDRALFNLSTALKLHYTAGLFGPTQSGKTETIQEVSKITGTQLVTFTCNPALSLSRILHFISGAVQSGALLCFENVTVLSDGILSVLGQHLDGIRQAFSALQKREFSQFEVRDPSVSKETSEEAVTKRRRGITVISLHTLLVNENAAGLSAQENDLQMTRKQKPQRRHSIHEIININDPKSIPNARKKNLKGVKSEMNLPKNNFDSSEETISEYKGVKPLGNIMVAGSLMKANPLYGCLMTISPVHHKYHSIPDNLRFLDDPVYTMSLTQIKAVVVLAGKACRDLKREHVDLNSVTEAKIEESCVAQALYSLMFTSVYPRDLPNFIRLLKVSFPQVKDSIAESSPEDQLLLLSVEQQIDSDNLLDNEDFVKKVMQLHATMYLNRSVILLGDSGSGKSACYQTLCRALCQFYSVWTQDVKKQRDKKNGVISDSANQRSSFSKVHLSTFYHKATNNDELFGNFNESTQNWSDGLLSKLLRTATQLQSVKAHVERNNEMPYDDIHYWFVFDGPLDMNLTGPLESLLDDRQELCLVNGEHIKPPSSVKFLFETTTLSNASPAIIARSAIVNFESKLVHWTCLFHSWKKTARNKLEISTKGFKVIEAMLEHICAPLAEFLSNDGEMLLNNHSQMATEDATVCSIEVTSVLQVLSAFLEKFMSREIAERRLRKESLSNVTDVDSSASVTRNKEEVKFISNSLAYAFVWAIAGKLHERCYPKFDVFTRQTFATCPYSVIFPCSVFDCMLDPVSGELVRWESCADIPKALPSQQYVVTPEIEKCFVIADLLIASGSNVLIVGERGVGKTAFVKNLIQQKYKMHRIVFTQGLSSQSFQKRVQSHIEEHINRFRNNPLKPPPQQRGLGTNKNVFFIDDIGMATVDPSCGQSQPTLEILRQIISEGQGNSSLTLSSRLTRRMNIINMAALKKESLVTVYASVYKSWLEEFPAYSLTHIEPLAKALSRSSVDIFCKIKESFTPSPTNPHFVFSHHDLARIAKGVFIYSPKSRLKARKTEKGLLDRAHSGVNQSLPDLKTADRAIQPDTSLSLSNLPTHLSTIDRFPASVSPLIRTIIRLWCHEVCRSFQDRMVENKDQVTFSAILNNTVMENFCGNIEIRMTDPNEHQILSRESSSLEKKTGKNRVKFKDIESSKTADYAGPLITFQHLLGEEKTLTDIKFTKHLFLYGSLGAEGAGEHDKGYVECQDQHVEEALRKSLSINISSDSKQVDLVLYKDAMQHAVRISRILALPGGHALLVSANGHGRANIASLVAKLANMKMMTVLGPALSTQSHFRSIVKDACFVAGLQGRPIVLFIQEGLSKEGMKDVASLMVEGTCPDLYSKDELTAIGNHLLPGGQVGQRRTESKVVAQDRFLRRIMTNLHIILCTWHGSLSDIAEEYPNILTRIACVDIYCEWTVDILKEVAERWLLSKGKNEFFFKVLWEMDNRDRQLSAIYTAMAHFHLSARNSLDKDFKDLGLDIFSPLKFIELVELFRTLCNAICQTKEDLLARLTAATDKIKEAERYVDNVEKSINDLTPLLETAKSELKTSEDNVKVATQEYHNSKQACVDQQKEVENLKQPIQVLRKEAKEEFGKLTPVYEAALAALKSLDIHDVEEMRSYRAPPVGVKFVADMICLMFEKPANWEDAKLLLIRENFFQDLVFYDKDKISDDLFRKLEKFSQSAESSPEFLLDISKAASSLSVWIRAVYNYCNVLHTFKPKQEEMKEAEKRLNQAKALLGEKRVYSHKMKAALEDSIEVFKDKMKETKSLEKQLQTLKRGKKKADNLLEIMGIYTKHWNERISDLKKKLRTAAGDALLTAATVCYLSAFGDEVRNRLKNEWVDFCAKGIRTLDGQVQIPLDQEFSVADILSSEDELIEWRRKGIPSDIAVITNALCTRTCSLAAKKCWPLLIDPQEQAPFLIRSIEEGLSGEWDKSATDDVESGTPKITDQSESRASSQRPISSFSAITNESAFLNKFYTKTGLKEVTDIRPPSPLVELTENTLIIVDADAADLDQMLKAAVAKGIPVLINHIERGVKNTFLASILSRTFSTAEGDDIYIRHESARLQCHPNFRLYLSAAVTMDFNKCNRFILPLHKALVIDLTMSKEGLENRFTSLTLQSEKPELESQRRSLRFDLFYLRQEKRRIQESILDRVCNISGEILEETSLLDAVVESRKQLTVTEERLDEGLIFQSELEARRQDYYQVAFHASMLHRVISMIGQLEPFYRMPLFFFDEQLRRTLEEAKRRKAESGSISARAAEINAKFTLDLYKRVCLNVFKEHVPFFPLLTILEGHLKDGKITITHYKVLLKLCSIENEVLSLPDSDWIDNDLRHRLTYIEEIEEFDGILKSFEKHQSQWREYFSMSPNLICSCPCGYENLSLFSKALLWLAVLPSKRAEVFQNLILNILGPPFTEVISRNIADVVEESLPSTPLVVLLPQRRGNILEEDATLTIENLGKSLNVQVITISFGVPSQLVEAVRVLRDVKGTSRKWLILENCHLVKAWSREFLRLIEEITENDGTNQHDSRHSTGQRRLFRLWFIFKCTADFKIPVAISKKGLLIAWDEKIYGHTKGNNNFKFQAKTNQQLNASIHESGFRDEQHDEEQDGGNNTFFGFTAYRKFRNEMMKHLKDRNAVTDHKSFAKTFAAHISNQAPHFPVVSESKSEVISSIINVIAQSEREFERGSKSLMMYSQSGHDNNDGCGFEQNDSRDVLKQLQSIHEALAKKTTSRLSKAVYQFFHREIKTMKEFCEKVMEFLGKSQTSTKKGASRTKICVLEKQLREYKPILNLLPYKEWQEWVTGLGAIANALLSYIRPKSRQPLGFDVNMIPHLKGFFASVMENFCHDNFAEVGEIHWEGKVLQESDELLPPIKGVYLKSLELRNADWKFDTKELIAANKTNKVYILHVVPKERSSSVESVDIPITSVFSSAQTNIISVNINSSLNQDFVSRNSVCFVNKF